MQWDNTPTAGFSTAAPENLYLPVFTDNGKLTVEAQEKDPNSVLNFTRQLIKLRHEHPMLANAGNWETISDSKKPYPWVYTRSNGTETYIVALNPGEKNVSFLLEDPSAIQLETLIANGKVTSRKTKAGIEIKLPGISSAIFKVVK